MSKPERLTSLFLSISLALFATAPAQTPLPDRAPATDRARMYQLRQEGASALYSLDYENARQKFTEIARTYPDHPLGPQMLASTLWLQKLNEARRLQAALYSTQSFYAKTEEKTDPQLVEKFRTLVNAARKLAAARVKANPQDAEALYYVGAADSLKAVFEASYERRFVAALHDGSSSVDRMREVLKLDPGFHDAELTIGLYDYIVGSLSLPIKLVASIAGFHGSKKRGIETLQRVAKEARWNNNDARTLLVALLKREKRFPESLEMSRELSAKYPRNFLFKLESADTLAMMAAAARQAKKTEEAEQSEREAIMICEDLLHEHAKDESGAPPADLVHFRFGETLLLLDQPRRAAEEFAAAAASPSAEASLVTLAHLRAANALDLAGKRDTAMTEYRVVLGRNNVYNSQDEARKGLREPYKTRVQ